MRKIFWSVGFLLLGSVSYAQDVQKVLSKEEAANFLQKVLDFYNKTTEYTVQTKMLAFEDYVSNTPTDTSLGFYSRKGDCVTALSLGLRTIQDQSIKITVDSAQKIILLSAPETSFNTSIEHIKYSIDRSIKIEYKALKNKEHFFFYYPEGSEYSKVKITIEPNGFISEYFLFYTIQDNMSEEVKVIKPRAEVYFYDFKIKAKKEICSLDAYIQTKDSKTVLSPAFQSYQLLDTRFKE